MQHASKRISPTAQLTAHVWYRHGLLPSCLTTRRGRALYEVLRIWDAAQRLAGHRTIEAMLLARHLSIDAALGAAIESGDVRHTVEIAAGLSGRGTRFSERFGAQRLSYVETDLEHVLQDKRARLRRAGPLAAGHRMEALDALAVKGERSLGAVLGRLGGDANGAAVISEGLLMYLPPGAVADLWRRIAAGLRERGGLYLSDLHVRQEVSPGRMGRGFRAMLQTFTRGRVYTHFGEESEVVEALLAAGFDDAELLSPADLGVSVGHRPGRSPIVRIVAARVAPGGSKGRNR